MSDFGDLNFTEDVDEDEDEIEIQVKIGQGEIMSETDSQAESFHPSRGMTPCTRRSRVKLLGHARSPNMTYQTATALSPLDGRYANKLDPLRSIFSEYGLIARRL